MTTPQQQGPRHHVRQPEERGSMAVELVLLAPVLVLFLLLMVGLGRMAHARQQVNAVAGDAARAASLERNTDLSAGDAKATARRALKQAGVSCHKLDVAVNSTNYRPGGSVSVRISCTATMSEVVFAGFPGSRQFTATSVVPIETYRSK